MQSHRTRPPLILIGSFYRNQEREKIGTTQVIYNTLLTQIIEAKPQGEIILGGDFNAKMDMKAEKNRNPQERVNTFNP